MITLTAVTRENYEAILRLTVNENQKDFVASNCRSLVQAAYEPGLNLLAIVEDDQPVGLILYDFDEEMGGWTMSRLMIDQHFQGQGFGKQALREFLKLFDEKYPGEVLYTSAAVDNVVAQKLYENFGFAKEEEFSYEYDGKIYKESKMKRRKEINASPTHT